MRLLLSAIVLGFVTVAAPAQAAAFANESWLSNSYFAFLQQLPWMEPAAIDESILLTPARPFYPHIAQLDMYGANSVAGGNFIKPESVQGRASLKGGAMDSNGALHGGGILLRLVGRAGKHYAIDCTMHSDPQVAAIQYRSRGVIKNDGSIQAWSDGHFVLATPSLPATGEFDILMWQPPVTSTLKFEGCKVSPF